MKWQRITTTKEEGGGGRGEGGGGRGREGGEKWQVRYSKLEALMIVSIA